MKIQTLTLLLCLITFVGCDEKSKNGEDSNSLFGASSESKKNSANQIILYYNGIIDYDGNAYRKINSFLKNDYNKLSNDVGNKEKQSRFITWTSFIGMAPKTKMGYGKDKVDLLEPQKYLESDLAKKVKPLVTGMVTAYDEIDKSYKDLRKYYDNEDYKDDDWQKGAEFLKTIKENSDVYFENQNVFFKTFEPTISKANEDILVGHPLKKELILTRKALNIVDELIGLVYDENADITAIEDSYKKLEVNFNEGKKIDKKALIKYKKENKYNDFYQEIESLLGAVRKAKRDSKISDKEYDNIKSDYDDVIRDFNYFVK